MVKELSTSRRAFGGWRLAILLVPATLVILMTVGLTSHLFSFRSPAKIDTTDVVSGPPSTPPAATPSTNVMKIAIAAMISPEKTRESYMDLITLIGRRMGRSVDIVQKKTYAQVNDLVESKDVDFAFVCSGPYTLGKQKFGMEILVVPVAYGQKVYYSYIIARADSKVASFDDLRGKRFAFTDPNSNTGCLVPRYMLGVRNETPETFFSVRPPIPTVTITPSRPLPKE